MLVVPGVEGGISKYRNIKYPDMCALDLEMGPF